MPLTKLHVLNVCKGSTEEENCRYLDEDEFDPNVFNCLKKTSRKNVIDEMIEKRKAINKNCEMPLGDNCPGYPVLRFVEVGYDKKD